MPFDSLSDESRVWVFAADPELDATRSAELLNLTDEFLREWAAHGQPLTAGRELLGGRFLVIGVDPKAADPSGCSIDGLYRQLKEFESRTATSLLSRDRVFYRDESGAVRGVSRDEFANLSMAGVVLPETTVFDTSIISLGEWRQRFELPASGSWHRALLAV